MGGGPVDSGMANAKGMKSPRTFCRKKSHRCSAHSRWRRSHRHFNIAPKLCTPSVDCDNQGLTKRPVSSLLVNGRPASSNHAASEYSVRVTGLVIKMCALFRFQKFFMFIHRRRVRFIMFCRTACVLCFNRNRAACLRVLRSARFECTQLSCRTIHSLNFLRSLLSVLLMSKRCRALEYLLSK